MNLVEFALAGKATFTVMNDKTGKHLTFKIKACKKTPEIHFVSVLTGSDNTSNYSYLGTIFSHDRYKHGSKSYINKEAQSNRAFEWLWPRLLTNTLPDSVHFIPAERCCVCGRKLTHPESCRDYIGPECRKRHKF